MSSRSCSSLRAISFLYLPPAQVYCVDVPHYSSSVVFAVFCADKELDYVAHERGFVVSQGFLGTGLLPVPHAVLDATALVQLRHPGHELVFERHVFRKDQVKARLAFVGVPDYAIGMLCARTGVLG